MLTVFALWWQSREESAAAPRYLTEPLTRGALRVTVTATGTLQPTNKVDIGSELSGTVAHVYVDVNDKVRRGQVLVALDTERLQEQIARSSAQRDAAEAKVQQVTATLEDAQGQLLRLQAVSKASAGRVPSQAEMAAAQAAQARAKADLASAKAAVQDAQAALSLDQTNLRKASIRSPIDGVVLARSVDPGNAVAASLQAVTLLTLAQDLQQLKLQVNVDEADVGRVREGQKAQFTVAAYPNREYPANVKRLSYGSTIKDNVVTYVAELQVANNDLSLRPGMTATAVITAEERDGVFLVPNAALRYKPEAAGVAPEGGVLSRLIPRMPAQAPRHATVSPGSAQSLWVLKEGQPTPVSITTGSTDGRMTEVRGEGLSVGQPIILDRVTGSAPR